LEAIDAMLAKISAAARAVNPATILAVDSDDKYRRSLHGRRNFGWQEEWPPWRN
jgi:hypothetical protein